MQFKLQIIIIAENGQEITKDITCLERNDLTPVTLGLSLNEGKSILKTLQEVVIEWQMKTYLSQQKSCPHCGNHRKSKGAHHTVFRTVFGDIPFQSPRLHHCPCQPHLSKTFSPLAELLPERTTPELLFLESKWASLMSYGLTVKVLQDVLPLDEPLQEVTIRNHVLNVADRLEQSLGDEQWSFIERCQRDWGHLPIPDGPITAGIDGGYVRARGKGCFEVIVGKSIPSFRRNEDSPELPNKCFAFVQTYDKKPKRRLFEVLQSQGMQMKKITFLSDGEETIRDIQLYLSPEAEHILDWFITMRITTTKQTARGLPQEIGDDQFSLRDKMLKELERIKWFLWNGNVFQALNQLESVIFDLEIFEEDEKARKLYRAVDEFHTYISRNRDLIPNYGERYRNGERISTGFVESTVNQVVSKRMVKKQQMQWSQRGAHLLLQVRTWVLNGEWEEVFREWYPGFRTDTLKEAA